jgi:hypothetical protein
VGVGRARLPATVLPTVCALPDGGRAVNPRAEVPGRARRTQHSSANRSLQPAATRSGGVPESSSSTSRRTTSSTANPRRQDQRGATSRLRTTTSAVTEHAELGPCPARDQQLHAIATCRSKRKRVTRRRRRSSPVCSSRGGRICSSAWVAEWHVPVELVTSSPAEYWQMMSEHVSLALAALQQVERTSAGADPGDVHSERECVREGRQGPASGGGALHRGNEIVPSGVGRTEPSLFAGPKYAVTSSARSYRRAGSTVRKRSTGWATHVPGSASSATLARSSATAWGRSRRG